MKRVLLLSLLLSHCLLVTAQDTVFVFSTLERIRDLSLKEQALYYCLVPDAKAPLQGLVTFYDKEGNMHAAVDYTAEGVRHGQSTYFYENGIVEKEVVFRNGSENGPYKTWYHNGQIHEEGEAISPEKQYAVTEFRLYNYWDSLGMQMVKDGEGYLTRFHKNGEKKEQGNYKQGRKVGAWNGYREDGRLYFEEEYKHGQLKQGKAHKDGKTFTYTQLEEEAQPAHGMAGFYQFLAKNIRYPGEAVRFAVQGTVYVRFVIDENGNVVSAETLNSLGHGLDEESVRVILLSKWMPGKQRGIDVMQRKIVPVKYKLAP